MSIKNNKLSSLLMSQFLKSMINMNKLLTKIKFSINDNNLIIILKGIIYYTLMVSFFEIFYYLVIKPFSFSSLKFSQYNFMESEYVFYAIIFAPFFETFIFQSCITKLAFKFIKSSKIVSIVSAMLFAFAHLYSLKIFIEGFVVGLIFVYYYLSLKKIGKDAFLLVSLIHMIINIIVLAFYYARNLWSV